MKVPLTQSKAFGLHTVGTAAAAWKAYWTEERMAVAAFVVGNLIFWGLFFLVVLA